MPAPSKNAYVVIAEFDVRAEKVKEFLALARADAENASISELGGCLQFDILMPENKSHRFTFYQVYDDRTAYAEHCESACSEAFWTCVPTLVISEPNVHAFTRIG